jgi:hypothetical protein
MSGSTRRSRPPAGRCASTWPAARCDPSARRSIGAW